MKKLLFASQNAGKQKEMQILLEELGIEMILPQDIKGCESLDVDETGETVQENSYLKANQFAQAANIPALADDSCLEVEALDGAPGVHSKRFFDGDRNLEIIRQLNDKRNRKAKFICSLCLASPNDSEDGAKYFEGVLEGQISKSVKGNEGFDYDFIFIPNGQTKTLAELGIKFKNTISHRAVAMKKLKKYLKSN